MLPELQCRGTRRRALRFGYVFAEVHQNTEADFFGRGCDQLRQEAPIRDIQLPRKIEHRCAEPCGAAGIGHRRLAQVERCALGAEQGRKLAPKRVGAKAQQQDLKSVRILHGPGHLIGDKTTGLMNAVLDGPAFDDNLAHLVDLIAIWIWLEASNPIVIGLS